MSGWILVLIIVALIVVAYLLAIGYGVFTRTGSGITPRPWGRRSGPEPQQPGAEGTEETSGRDEGDRVPMDYGTR
jgi:hypothetical protein